LSWELVVVGGFSNEIKMIRELEEGCSGIMRLKKAGKRLWDMMIN
jgi:hypothetical protein